MDMADQQTCSKVLCQFLDSAGINIKMKHIRSKTIQKVEKKLSELINGGMVITGSTAEGLFPVLRSDCDAMIYHNDLFCVEDSNGETNTLRPDYENAPPGYTKVLIDHFDDLKNEHVAFNLCSQSCTYISVEGQSYVSSSVLRAFTFHLVKKARLFTKHFLPFIHSVDLTNGPAVSGVQRSGQILFGQAVGVFTCETDIVVAFLFYNSNVLCEWASRLRNYDWPSHALIQEVLSTEGYIVPIGEKNSENQDLEWRISYVTAEKKLLSRLNGTQYKLYAVLKMLAKEFLTPLSKHFSSYIVKNIVLWVVERNPSSHFQPHFLLAILRQCLCFAKLCLQNNNLPNYLIPSRNLIAHRIVGTEKQMLINKINCLLDERTCFVLNVPQLAMYFNSVVAEPMLIERYGMWRNEVEQILLVDGIALLEHLNRDILLRPNGLIDCFWQYFQTSGSLELQFKLLNLVVPDWPTRVGDIYGLLDLVNARIKAILRLEMIPC